MSNERRRQQRAERKRQRRQASPAPTYEPASGASVPGAFGWIQRNGKLFYIVGITVMVLSLATVFIGTNLGTHSGTDDTRGTTATRDSDAADDAADDTTNDAAADSADAEDATDPEAADDTEADAEPDAADSADGIQRVYLAPPPMEIDVQRGYQALIRTEKGDVRIELLPDAAPAYVNNFVFLARNRFYDGLTFHRVVPGFVAQAGDPTGTGSSGPGYELEAEVNDLPFDSGVLSMAKSGETVDGAQFFITLEPQPSLEANFTVFGRVTEGLDVVRALTDRNPGQPGQPPGDLILSIEITESEPTAASEDDSAADSAADSGS